MKIADLSKLITTQPDYDEEFNKNLLTIIVEERKLIEQQEFEKEREKLDREFQLEKLQLENERLKGLTSTPEDKVSVYELTKVVPKFETKDGDMGFFLTLFERQGPIERF
ncbi:hypothetical protein TNCV_1631031 [Trichonephila clavipes]|nr:hypothetical protein TNCV_1631031 [Trichonephila clavipes]